jgi:predicted lipid-binding transport protein (Tim44 family)
MRINERHLNRIVCEEITKTEVQNIISDKLQSAYKSNDFDQAVRKITADVVENLFKILWQRNTSWKTSLERK